MEVTGLSIEDYNGMQKRIKDLEAIQKGESFSYDGTDYHILQGDEVTLQLLKLLELKKDSNRVILEEELRGVGYTLRRIERGQKDLEKAVMDKRFLGWTIVFVQTVLLIGALFLFIAK